MACRYVGWVLKTIIQGVTMDLLVKKIAKFLIAGVIFLGIASADTDKFGLVDIKEVYYKDNKAIKLEEVFNK